MNSVFTYQSTSNYTSSNIPLDALDCRDKLIRLVNGYVLQSENLIQDDLWVKNGIIYDGLDLFFNEKATANIVIDVHGAVVSPGFIDIQVNGGYGMDFSSAEGDIALSVYEISRRLPETGVTSFCPTIITSPTATYNKIFSKFQNYSHQKGCAKVLGLHMEGPFISRLRPGMHPVSRILDFGEDPVKTILETYQDGLKSIRMVTLAPELTGSTAAISEFVSKGISVSIGHTNADCKALQSAILSGATFMTHLFNSMPSFHHRDSHIFGGITIPTPAIYVGLIADLVHVHPAALRLAEAIAPGRVVLVTDANTSFGLPDGTYTFGEQTIEATGGVAYISGTNYLAGGTTPLSKCIRNFWVEVYRQQEIFSGSKWLGLGAALAAASTRPARGLGLFQAVGSTKLSRGSLEAGAQADFTIICPDSLSLPEDPVLDIISTWIDGVPVFTAKKAKFTVYFRTEHT